MYLQAVNAHVHAEDVSNRGRADMTVFHANQAFVMEFKVVEDARKAEEKLNEAMAQMREQGYGKKYLNSYAKINLIAIVFGKKERNLLKVLGEVLRL